MKSGAVVHDHAVLAKHQPVAGLAHRQRPEAVRIKAVDELGRVGALDVDFAQGRHVAKPDRLAGGDDLSARRRHHVLAALRVVAGAQPLPGLHEYRAGALRPLVHGRQPRGLEVAAARGAGQHAHGHGNRRRAKGGGADPLDRFAALGGENGQAVDVGQLALVRGHAEGGVALEMLHRAVALARGQRDVCGSDVVLQVHQRLAVGARHAPKRLDFVRRGAVYHG